MIVATEVQATLKLSTVETPGVDIVMIRSNGERTHNNLVPTAAEQLWWQLGKALEMVKLSDT